ncbi:MAG: deoxynucleoside kinase [Deltaproteobacteria bacterium]|nr:deoxynucleoside kinase [Deltaproteobacteria bacterium]
MIPFRYIAIEGPIGAGKTTLSHRLSQEFNARLVLEEAEENPFLPLFYENQEAHAFQVQVFFLLSRYRQQKSILQQDLFQQVTVSDYLFAKDKIFAELNLSEEEWELYQNLYKLLDAALPKPDLVIFLQASHETLRKRIKKRGLDYEKSISGNYIQDLSEAYNQFFFHYDEAPVLTVNCTEMDILEQDLDYQFLLKEILAMANNKLKKHYVSISSK